MGAGVNALIFAVALAFPQPAPVVVPQPTTAIRVVLVAHAAAQMADLVSTRTALTSGRGNEANPLMRPFAGSTWKLATVKALTTAGISAALWWIHAKHPKVALVVGGLLTVGTSYIAYRNTQVGR